MNGKEKDKAKKDLDEEVKDFKNNNYEDLREVYEGKGPDSINLGYEIGKQLAKKKKKKK